MWMESTLVHSTHPSHMHYRIRIIPPPSQGIEHILIQYTCYRIGTRSIPPPSHTIEYTILINYTCIMWMESTLSLLNPSVTRALYDEEYSCSLNPSMIHTCTIGWGVSIFAQSILYKYNYPHTHRMEGSHHTPMQSHTLGIRMHLLFILWNDPSKHTQFVFRQNYVTLTPDTTLKWLPVKYIYMDIQFTFFCELLSM